MSQENRFLTGRQNGLHYIFIISLGGEKILIDSMYSPERKFNMDKVSGLTGSPNPHKKREYL
jgi:hypothetical protein